jgi:hypothetical protein
LRQAYNYWQDQPGNFFVKRTSPRPKKRTKQAALHRFRKANPPKKGEQPNERRVNVETKECQNERRKRPAASQVNDQQAGAFLFSWIFV